MALLLILLFMVIIPFIRMVWDSFIWHYTDTRLSRSAQPGWPTLFHWKRIFAGRITGNVLLRPLFNSVSTSLGISLFAMLIGSMLAWLVTRTDLPLRKIIATLAVIPYIIPSYIHALAWLNLFKNDRIDSRLEKSGEILGASRFYILRRITFPIIIPALLSSFILTFSRALGIFGTPYFLGSPVRFFTLSTQIYANITNRVPAAGFLGIFIGYAVVKGRHTRLADTVEQVSFLPYLVPGIAFGAIYLSLFIHKIGPIPALYGTFLLLALVCIAKNFPFTGRTGITAMLQIGSELEEASEIAGELISRKFGKKSFI